MEYIQRQTALFHERSSLVGDLESTATHSEGEREREEDGKREENQTKCELLVIRGVLVSKHFV